MNRLKFLFVIIFVFGITLVAQESLRGQLFNEVDQLLKKANGEKASLYSPQNYKMGMTSYQNAKTRLNKGGNINDIREYVDEAKGHFDKALYITNLVKITLATALESREAALSAKADVYAEDPWKEAEEYFNRAMENMEDSDLDDAHDYAGQAETFYRKSELIAIKVNLLGPAKAALVRAEDLDAEDYAPKSFQRAQESIQKVELMINKNRYAQEEGLALAKIAKYETKHTIYLTETIKKFKDKEFALEDIFLVNEKNLSKIGDVLDQNLDFSEGFGKPREEIITDLYILKESLEAALQTNISLNDQIAIMKIQIGEYSVAEEELQKVIDRQQEQERKIKMISVTFTREEAQVFRDGDRMIIRLYGLTFPSGKTEIKPAFFSLLRKVQDGIREFENCEVVIEGHTDSYGGAALNQRLSEERANAVQEYLLANMNIDRQRFSSTGFGETKPIANNETKAGRAKNRRIDLVIIPEWALEK